MSYQGGKQKLGKRIHDVISLIETDILDDENKKLDYFEPFVGFCGVIKHFNDENRKCTANDINEDIIKMWKNLQNGWKPPKYCNKDEYEKLKKSKKHSAKKGFIGTACSYGGIYFVGYRSKQKFKHKTINSVSSARRSVLKIKDKINNVKFLKPTSYNKFNPVKKLIYCDPPYVSNKYTQSEYFNFDSEKFWDTMRKWSKKNIVVISERNAPSDFKKIWSIDFSVTQHGKVNNQNECLFIHETLFDILSNHVKNIIKKI